MDLEENMFLFATLSYLHLTEIRPVYALNFVTVRKTNVHNWPTIRTHIQCYHRRRSGWNSAGTCPPRSPVIYAHECYEALYITEKSWT